MTESDGDPSVPPVPYAPYGPYTGPRQTQYVYLPPPPKNDLAVWSLVTGILSWIFCPFVLGIVAIVMGYASKQAARKGLADNVAMATAGLILGWINVGVIVGFFVLWALFGVFTLLGAGIVTFPWSSSTY